MLMLILSVTFIMTTVIGLLLILCQASNTLPEITDLKKPSGLCLARYTITFSFGPQINFKNKYQDELNFTGLMLIEILMTAGIIIANIMVMAVLSAISIFMLLWNSYLKIFKKKTSIENKNEENLKNT